MDRKVGVVTGAGGDIGIAVCEELARRGVGVLCVDRTQEFADRAKVDSERFGALIKARNIKGD